jgi:hypothetical protein
LHHSANVRDSFVFCGSFFLDDSSFSGGVAGLGCAANTAVIAPLAINAETIACEWDGKPVPYGESRRGSPGGASTATAGAS